MLLDERVHKRNGISVATYRSLRTLFRSTPTPSTSISPIPLHPGSVRYFVKVGYEVPDRLIFSP